MSTQSEKREAYRQWIASRVKFANGYYYTGNYQPATMTGRHKTKALAIKEQMDAADVWAQTHDDAYDFPQK